MMRLRSSRVMMSRGFTLIETIIVVVVLAIAAVAVGAIQGRLFQGQAGLKSMQVGTKLMQECAEQILGTRRFAPGSGYAALGIVGVDYQNNVAITCPGVSSLSGFATPTVTFTDPYVAVGTCPGPCKLAKIRIAQMGNTELTLLLVDY